MAPESPMLQERVGQTRIQVTRLMALLISFCRADLNQALHESGIFLTMIVSP